MSPKLINPKTALQMAIFALKDYRRKNHAIGHHAHELGQDFIFAARDHEAYEKFTRAIKYIESLFPLIKRLEPKKKIRIKGLTTAQNDWLNLYEGSTGFEPLHLEDLESGEMTFDEAAKSNINWYENHSSDAFAQITDHTPYS